MCRLMCYASKDNESFSELIGPKISQFVDLSSVHKDGWGIAKLKNNEIQLQKNPSPAIDDSLFNNLLVEKDSQTALLHFRWATTGMEISESNTHPFVYQENAFIHNGSIENYLDLKNYIKPEYLENLEGGTDSEIYFYYLLSKIDANKPDFGLKDALNFLVSLDITGQNKYSSLNAMLIFRNYLIVISLYHQDRIPMKFKDFPDYYELRYKIDGNRFICASSSWDQTGWELLNNMQFAILDLETLQISKFNI